MTRSGGRQMSFGSFLILSMVGRINGDRSLSGIIHLLRGRQSIQTIQDSMLFHAGNLYHVYDTVPKERFITLAEDCLKKGWIAPKGEASDKYILTVSGHTAFKQMAGIYTFPSSLKYTEFVKSETDFWLGLQLMIQALSEEVHHVRSYLPITRKPSVTHAVRQLFLQPAQRTEQLGRLVFHELSLLLTELPESAADLLVCQLSGFGTAGLTTEQSGQLFNQDLFFCKTMEKAAIRQIMQRTAVQPGRFPSLASLFSANKSRLSQSSRITYELLMDGKGFSDIAGIRHLSNGTIEDHIVEITLNVPGFDVTPYLAPALEKKILEAAGGIGSRQLKPIRSALGDQADYFQIRLALAKEAVNREEIAHGPSQPKRKGSAVDQ